MLRFAIATTAPAMCICIACVAGGVWAPLALALITVVAFFLDKLTRENATKPPTKPTTKTKHIQTTTTEHALPFVLGAVHFLLLGCVIWAVSIGKHLTLIEKMTIFAAASLWFGQVSNSNAHELIHHSSRRARRLGAAIYASLLFGHHTSAHLRVHHVHAATSKDPNSARSGEGFYRFAHRAWRHSFRQGLRAENAARARAQHAVPAWQHPYVWYGLGGSATILAAFGIGGTLGGVCLLVLALGATTQLLLSDYVQHYGLERKILADGKPEPIGPNHSWNAPHWYSNAMMLNAPRHSDHHMHPGTRFPHLALDPDKMPMLPQSLPVMAVVALIPPLWKKMMDPRVARWTDRQNPSIAQDHTAQHDALLLKGGLPPRGVAKLPNETKTIARPRLPGPDPGNTPQRRTNERGGL